MKKKSTWIKLIFVIVLILIILYTFRGSMGDIVAQMKQTAPIIIVAICASSVVYHLFEGWITYSLARRYNPQFKYRNGVCCAFFTSFYRLSTLGSAQGVAAVLYMGKRGVGYSEATGLYMIQYMVHKVSIAIFSGIFFLINWRVMAENYHDYAGYLILAYGLTALIATGLVIFGVNHDSHRLILFLVKKLNFKNKLDGAIKKLEESSTIIEHATKDLITDPKFLVGLFAKTIVRLLFWYCIPFLILYGTGELDLLSSLSVTSLSVMTAAVIPTPAGIGSTELVMTALFRVLVPFQKAAAVTLLYRLATFIFPFFAGAVMILCGRIYSRFRR